MIRPAPSTRAAGAAVARDRRRARRIGLIGSAIVDDRGSILPLVIVYCLISVLLVAVVVAASSLYLERTRLFSLADGAALAGADAFPLDDVRVVGGAPRAALADADVAAAASDYLARAPHADFDDLTVVRSGSDDGASATVTLSAVWHPPLAEAILPAGVPVQVTSRARGVFR